MSIHPEAEKLLAMLEEAGMPLFEEATVPANRAIMDLFPEMQGEIVQLASVENRLIPSPDSDIPVRIYTPAGEGPFPVLMYFHGGGWTIGNLDSVDRPCRQLANGAGAIIVSVDYRLAPEHPFPAAFNDCYAATAWTAENCADFQGDATRLAIAGDSAGGNLAAAVTVVARDRNGPPLRAQILIYPAVDFDFSHGSFVENAAGPILTTASVQWFWAHYLGAADPGDDPRAFPARSKDFRGLPPTYIATAELDPVRDEGEAYAVTLRNAGVPVTSRRFDGMVHGFFFMMGVIPSTAVILDEIVGVLSEAWASE